MMCMDEDRCVRNWWLLNVDKEVMKAELRILNPIDKRLKWLTLCAAWWDLLDSAKLNSRSIACVYVQLGLSSDFFFKTPLSLIISNCSSSLKALIFLSIQNYFTCNSSFIHLVLSTHILHWSAPLSIASHWANKFSLLLHHHSSPTLLMYYSCLSLSPSPFTVAIYPATCHISFSYPTFN